MIRSLMCCAVIGFIAILSATPSTFGGIVFSDNFNKANQPLVTTTPVIGGAWSNVSAPTTNPLSIVSNAVPLSAGGGEDALSLTAGQIPTTPGNVIHTGLDINVSSATATGDYFQHLGDGSTSIFFQRLFAKSSGTGYVLGLVDTSGTGSTITYGSTVLSFGTSNHVDINWTPVAGNNNDTFAVLVNTLPYLTHIWTSTTVEPTLIKSANLRQGGATTSAALTVDNYVVDAPVTVPEPATIMLLGIIGVAGLGCRRVANRRSR
jgi:hypothetical protein